MYAIKVVESVVPGIFPHGWADLIEVPEKEFKNQLIDFLFRRDVLACSRDSVAGTKVGESLQNDWNIFVFAWAALVEGAKKVLDITPVKYSLWRLKRALH